MQKEYTKRQARKDYKQASKMNREIDLLVTNGEVESYQDASEIVACLQEIDNDKTLSEKAKRVAKNALYLTFEAAILTSATIMANASVENFKGENPITASHPEVAGIAGLMITASYLGGAAITEYMRRDSNSVEDKRDMRSAQWRVDYRRKQGGVSSR